AVSAHRDGSIWVAMNVLMPAWTDLTARFDGKAWTVFDSLKSGEMTGGIQDLRCDSAGNVWVLNSQSLHRWDGVAWQEYSWYSSQFLKSGISAITVDAQGGLWAATTPPNATLLHWVDGWQAVPDAAGRMGRANIRSMAGDGAGRMWLATERDGLLL